MDELAWGERSECEFQADKWGVAYTDGSYSISDDGTNLDWSIGAEIEVSPNLTFGAEYVGIDGPRIRNFSDDAIVFKLVASF